MSLRLRQWIGYCIMLIGLGFLVAPFLMGSLQEHTQQQVVENFYRVQRVQKPIQTPTATETAAVPVPEETEETAPAEDSELYRAAQAYNQSLLHGGQDGMHSLADLETFALDARKFGMEQNVIGTIRIPRLEVELGLYLGASGENMAQGAAIFGMTSIPLGLPDENVAIAGHRGWRGSAVFRDIQLIQLDDPIYITTPWGDLVYRVTELQIVTPDDLTWCRIVTGKTMISLMTCHPYGANYQRYIVHAELTQEEKPEEAEILRQNEESFDPAAKNITVVNPDGTRDTAIVDSAAITPDGREYGTAMSSLVITAEDSLRPVAYAAILPVALIGLWLVIQTIRDIRKQKGEKHNESE